MFFRRILSSAFANLYDGALAKFTKGLNGVLSLCIFGNALSTGALGLIIMKLLLLLPLGVCVVLLKVFYYLL